MENSGKMRTTLDLENWIETHSNELELVQFNDVLSDEIIHFQINSRADDSLSGFGTDFSREVALRKAWSEYMERKALREHAKLKGGNGPSQPTTSNGFAAHLTETLAAQNARLEVIERDAFFWMWFSRSTPCWLPSESLSHLQPRRLEVLKSALESHGMWSTFGIVAQTNGFFTVVNLLESQKGDFGYAISTACKSSIVEGLEAVILDSFRLANVVVNRLSNGEPVARAVSKREGWKASSHLELSLSSPLVPKWLKVNPVESVIVLPEIEFEVEKILTTFDPLELYVMRAIGVNSLSYYVGETQISNLNVRRLKELGLALTELNMEVHPLP
jgi:hypothetical protein